MMEDQRLIFHTQRRRYRLAKSFMLLVGLLLSVRPAVHCQEYPSSVSNMDIRERKQFNLFFPTADTAAIFGLIRKGVAVQNRNKDSALMLFRQAITRSRRSDFTDGVSRALLSIGLLYGNLGNYSEGLRYFRQAYSYGDAGTKHSKFSADLYNDIGLAYYYLGDYTKAVYYYYCAINDYTISWNIVNIPEEGNKSLALTYCNLAVVLTDLKKYHQSLYYLDLASRIARHNNYLAVVPQILINRGTVYVALNELDRAFAADLEALQKSRECKYREAEYVANCGLGEILIKKGLPKQAIPYLEAAMNTDNPSSMYYAASMPVHLLGTAWYQMKDYGRAKVYVLQSLEQARKNGQKRQTRDALEMLASIYKQIGGYKQGLEYQEAYSLLKDSLLNEDMSSSVSRMEVQYRTAQKDKELIRKQVQIDSKNKWIWIITGVLFFSVLLLLLFLRHKQRLHLKKIRILEQDKEIRSLKAMMQGEEKERGRIARDLHDGIGGMLAAIKMSFSSMQHKYGTVSEAKDFKDIMLMLDETGREVHETAHNLMPDILIRYGLCEAVRLYIENINPGGQLQIDLQMEGIDEKHDRSFQLSVYRIVQELVQNVLKHAHATHMLVQIMKNGDILTILVEDNGKGFNTEERSTGLGLRNLQFRVHALQGGFSLQSAPEKGTLVYIEFDLQKTKSLLEI